jgi:3-oxoacyl-[acyl-carrier-protein] synthase III
VNDIGAHHAAAGNQHRMAGEGFVEHLINIVEEHVERRLRQFASQPSEIDCFAVCHQHDVGIG